MINIAGKLKRSPAAIIVRKEKLKLGAFLESAEYITFNRLIKLLGISSSGTGYKEISWVRNRGFPMQTKKVKNNSFKIVYIDKFWKWAEKNREMIDFSKLEPNIPGRKPRGKVSTMYGTERLNIVRSMIRE